MKILALSDLYPPDVIGGYELACAQVVDALRARGHDVLVLTSAPRRPVVPAPHVLRTLKLTDVWDAFSEARSAPATRHLLNAESRFINAFNVHALIDALGSFRPDVVYVCNLIGLGGLGLMGCLQYLRVPWVWQLGDRVPHYMCCKWEQVVPGLAREFSRAVRGHFIVVSTRLRDEIESSGVVLNGTVDVLPNWVVGDRPPPRHRFFRRGGHLRVVSAGQMIRNKGMDLVIEAAARLRADGHDDFSVDLYGRLGDPGLPNLVKTLDVEDHVFLKGALPQAELLERYGRYDVFAFPTWEREPFGLGPLEASSRGCVAVMTQNCGVGEWLVHGVHALKAERTASAFARVLGAILDGEIDLEPIGRRAQAVVGRDFHIDAILPRIESALAQAARRPRDGAGSAEEAYRLALLAEKLTRVLVQEPLCA